MRQMELALGDLQMGRRGQFVRGEAADEVLQGRDAAAQIFVVAGLGAVPRLGQVERRLCRPIAQSSRHNPFALRLAVRLHLPIGTGNRRHGCHRLQQLPPGLSRLRQLAGGQQAFAHPVASFHLSRVVGLVREKLLVGLRRVGRHVQLLQAIADTELDFRTPRGRQSGIQGEGIELPRAAVVGLLIFTAGLESRVGKLQVNGRRLLPPRGGEQILGLRFIDCLGAAEVALGNHGLGLGKAGATQPRALGKVLLELFQRGNRLVVLLLQFQRPGPQIGKVVAGRVLVLGGFVNGLAGLDEVAILHRLPHGRRRQRHVAGIIDRRAIRGGQWLVRRGQEGQEKTDSQAAPAHSDTPLRLCGPHGGAICLCSLARKAKSPEDPGDAMRLQEYTTARRK